MNKKKKSAIIVSIITLTVFLIHVINKFVFFLSTMKDRLYSENSHYYNWRFGRIFYTKKGTGSPLLLVHDLNCTSSDFEWKEVINDLSKRYTVYTIDLLGCGRSEKPKITYTNYLYVQLISDFIKNIIKHKTKVIATGKSSSSIIMACYSDNQLFDQIALVNPEMLLQIQKIPKHKNKLLKYLIDSPVLGTMFYNMIVSKNIIKDDFQNKYFYNKHKIRNKYINAYNESAHIGGINTKYTYSSIKSHYTNINIVHALKEVNNSIFLVCGEFVKNKDIIINDYVSLNPAIEIIEINDTKQLPQLECPKQFVNQLLMYFS